MLVKYKHGTEVYLMNKDTKKTAQRREAVRKAQEDAAKRIARIKL